MRERPSGRRILLLSDPWVAALPIAETGEALLDVREAGLRLDGRKRDAPAIVRVAMILCIGSLL